MKGFRSLAREAALQLLYRQDVLGDPAQAPCQHLEHFGLATQAHKFAVELYEGAVAHSAQLDEQIMARLSGWKFERLSAIDRSLLRLALYELIYTKEDTAVILDEAIELAKAYGQESSGAFANALLDRAAKALRVGAGSRAGV